MFSICCESLEVSEKRQIILRVAYWIPLNMIVPYDVWHLCHKSYHTQQPSRDWYTQFSIWLFQPIWRQSVTPLLFPVGIPFSYYFPSHLDAVFANWFSAALMICVCLRRRLAAFSLSKLTWWIAWFWLNDHFRCNRRCFRQDMSRWLCVCSNDVLFTVARYG